ncbi:MAG TPA: hypothetical protein VFP14_07495, partial [Novosphingobium sp.]|nr:hypothetical protein [Novosphingobium sp.]
AEFKRAGDISVARQTLAEEPPAAEPPASAAASPVTPATSAAGATAKRSPSRLPLIGGVAALAVAAIAGGVWLSGHSQGDKAPVQAEAPGAAALAGAAPGTTAALPAPGAPAGLPADLQALVAQARQGNAPAAAVQALAGAAASGPQGPAAVIQASRSFAGILRADVEQRSQQLAAKRPWADPRRAGAASGQGADQVRLQARLVQARAGLGSAAAGLAAMTEPTAALAGARQALAQWQDFAGLQFRASRIEAASAKPALAAEPVSAEAQPEPAKPAAAGKGAPAGKAAELAAIIAECQPLANQVIAAGRSARPNSSNEKDRQNARVLEQNVTTARNYMTYLRTLSSAMSGAKDAREADRLIAQAEQTKRYLLVLLSRSTTAAH